MGYFELGSIDYYIVVGSEELPGCEMKSLPLILSLLDVRLMILHQKPFLS
jgi:hypothetical protein